MTAALASLIGYGVSLLGTGAQDRLEGVIGGGPSIAALFCFSGVLSLAALLYGVLRLPRAAQAR